MKLKNFQSALEYFERSLDMAKLQGDKLAEKAIKHAMEDANRKILKSQKGEENGGEEDRRSARSDRSDKSNKSKRSTKPEGMWILSWIKYI